MADREPWRRRSRPNAPWPLGGERGDAGLWGVSENVAARLAVTEESGDLGNMRQMLQVTSLREVYRIVCSMNSELIPHEQALYQFLSTALERLPLEWRYRSVRAIWAHLEPSFLLHLSQNRDRPRVPIRRLVHAHRRLVQFLAPGQRFHMGNDLLWPPGPLPAPLPAPGPHFHVGNNLPRPPGLLPVPVGYNHHFRGFLPVYGPAPDAPSRRPFPSRAR